MGSQKTAHHDLQGLPATRNPWFFGLVKAIPTKHVLTFTTETRVVRVVEVYTPIPIV